MPTNNKNGYVMLAFSTQQSGSILKSASAVTTFLLLLLFTTPSHAFKVDVHIWIGQEVLNQISKQGTISLSLDNKKIELPIPADRLAAVRRYPEYFLMGCIGPDAYPDVIVGQMVIHPGNPHHWGSADWLRHLMDSAKTDQEKAFALGTLIHAASDVFAHTYVNRYAGAIFDIGDNEEASLRHVKLESYLSNFLPPLRDAAGKLRGLPHEVVRTPNGKLAIPADFLRAQLYFDSHAVDEIKSSGSAGYIPLIASLKTNLDHAAEDGGLVDDLTTLGVQMAALIWLDVNLSKEDAEKLKMQAQKIHGYMAFTDELHDAINEADKAVRGFHSATRGEFAKHFAKTEKAMADLLAHKQAIDRKKQEFETKLREWSDAPEHRFEEVLEDTCNRCSNLDLGCKAACSVLKKSIDVGATAKNVLFHAKDELEKQVHKLEGQTLEKQKAVHEAALDWMDAVTLALDTKIAINTIQASYFSDEHSQDPLKFFVRNWNSGIDTAMSAFVTANGETIINTITPAHRGDLDPYMDWFKCYGLAILSVPVQITGGICEVKNGIENIKLKIDELQGHLSQIDPVSEALFKLKKEVEEKVDVLKHDLIDQGTDAISKGFDTALDQRTNYWMKALTKATDAAALNREYAVDDSNSGLPLIPDIAARVDNELGAGSAGTRDITKLSALRDALVLSKLALLDQSGLNALAAKAGVTYGIYGQQLYGGESVYAANVLYGMARSIDGNHQWHEVAPPNPKQTGFDAEEFAKRHQDIEAGFTYRDPSQCFREKGMRMWVDPIARKKIFAKLFVAPLPAGVDLPSFLGSGFPEVLVNYPNTVTKENPWGNDGVRLPGEADVRHAKLHGFGVPGTTVVVSKGGQELARTLVDGSGRWETQADITLSRTELLTFAVFQEWKQKERRLGEIELSFCTDQTDAAFEMLVEVRSFVLIEKDDNLSRLAKLLSGHSDNYVTIFDKNKHLIRDQDLIFPNQIFEVPGEQEWKFKPTSPPH
ncbi:MAG: zinc dependent phospholipase C family protein [Steroidobacteraceae bacterium]